MSKRTLTGRIVSTKMQKTVVVAIEMTKRHPLYKKLMKNTKRLKVRDEVGVKVGDVVKIEESRPYSKSVSWKVLEVVETTKGGK